MLYLSKLLPVFVLPPGSAICIGLLGLLFAALSWRRLSLVSFCVSILWLWIASTPVFADWALGTLERQHPPLTMEAVPSADVAIVLGGALGQALPPRTAPDLGQAADRVLEASRFYREGKVDRILVTGGQLPWTASRKPEAALIRDLLVEWGVDATAIEIATGSRNTYENALEIKEIHAQRPFRSALLITSASHMPRALAVFEKAELPVIAATTDVQVLEGQRRTILDWLPHAMAMDRTAIAMREWIGLLAYRLLGYA